MALRLTWTLQRCRVNKGHEVVLKDRPEPGLEGPGPDEEDRGRIRAQRTGAHGRPGFADEAKDLAETGDVVCGSTGRGRSLDIII